MFLLYNHGERNFYGENGGNGMKRKKFKTSKGTIVYWTNEKKENAPELVFLPGLTADHRLFIKQIQHFQNDFSVFVWDAPGHAFSYPFEMDFTLEDKARWLDEILIKEGYDHPIIIGQSMGGYVGQMYAELFPEKLAGFISIDSAPLQRKYYKEWELKSLEYTEPMYRMYPWKLLMRHGTDGVATSRYGRGCMYRIMLTYDKDKPRYAKLAGHGFYIVAQAIKAELPYEITCPSLLICGTKDQAGFTKRYNKEWAKQSGIPIEWIEGAGHNSNTDNPEEVNNIIENFISEYYS